MTTETPREKFAESGPSAAEIERKKRERKYGQWKRDLLSDEVVRGMGQCGELIEQGIEAMRARDGLQEMLDAPYNADCPMTPEIRVKVLGEQRQQNAVIRDVMDALRATPKSKLRQGQGSNGVGAGGEAGVFRARIAAVMEERKALKEKERKVAAGA